MTVINARDRFRQNLKPGPRHSWLMPMFAMSAFVALLTALALQFFGVLR